ncbi:DUF72 domain-containing protein [Vagococcus intermedius]|uniref:DUF72 domain-containing protein n=1 Tax=Vagococcus intermedius TaxID=2991418 RepID=A0AAF0CVU9_9ENTE|nr:DUF72 domain-containing protein [Vagococcus intermedius]WEG73914.1 DUF72 domain-containing protein [Vagococcus intermedius]WEG75996.1 DUF72 domain-containing protein [Vagococcus intermedius]
MIKIGLTGWSEHVDLLNKNNISLGEYSSVLPIVEIDTFFYGIPRVSTVAEWVKITPPTFKCVIKAHQSMTTHRPWQDFYDSEKELYQKYLESIQPLVSSDKLSAILCQFPASFHCTTENILYLKRLRKIFSTLPLAIEFRHISWYLPENKQGMVEFMMQEQLSLLVVDEPQVLGKSIPFEPILTTSPLIFRLHGRNLEGWKTQGDDWRKKRTLYCYNRDELNELALIVKAQLQQTTDIIVIFNNNSGGDAAANALTFKSLLNLEYKGLNPQQLNLF